MIYSIKGMVTLLAGMLIFVILSFRVSAAQRCTVTDDKMRQTVQNAIEWEKRRYDDTDSLAGSFIENGLSGEAEADWFILSQAAIGIDDDYQAYAEESKKALNKKLENADDYYLTEFARTSIVIRMLGEDSPKLSDLDYSDSGDNELIWLIIAQKCGNMDYEEMLDELISRQGSDGSFSEDADITAMALNALERDSDSAKSAIEYLSEYYKENYDKITSETNAQIIVGLCSQGINPTQSMDFTAENGVRPIDILLYFQTDEGGFLHTSGGEENLQSSMQSLTALAAIAVYSQNECGLYSPDFRRIDIESAENISADGFDDYDKSRLEDMENPTASNITELEELKSRAQMFSADEYLTIINEKLMQAKKKADIIESLNSRISEKFYPPDKIGVTEMKDLMKINDEIALTDESDRELILSAVELSERERVLKIRLFAMSGIVAVIVIFMAVIVLKRNMVKKWKEK